MTRCFAPIALLAVAVSAVAGCAERRYPWPDFQVSDDAWVALPIPPRAEPAPPLAVPLAAPPPSRPFAAGFRP